MHASRRSVRQKRHDGGAIAARSKLCLCRLALAAGAETPEVSLERAVAARDQRLRQLLESCGTVVVDDAAMAPRSPIFAGQIDRRRIRRRGWRGVLFLPFDHLVLYRSDVS